MSQIILHKDRRLDSAHNWLAQISVPPLIDLRQKRDKPGAQIDILALMGFRVLHPTQAHRAFNADLVRA